MATVNYDFIIIGGGSSGSTLASILSTKGPTLLIERGANHTAYPQSEVRQGWPQISALTLDSYKAIGSGHWVGTANILGGGSALNGGVCWRGERKIFEGLGLDLDEVERSFELLEDTICLAKAEDSEYDKAFIDAWVDHGSTLVESSSGFASWADINATDNILSTVQRGRSLMLPSGKRRPASYLFENGFSDDGASILSQGNLTVFLLTNAKKVLFSEKKEAVGVDINSPAGDFSVYVRRGGKIFLNAGSFETPKLLMLSGVGPSDVLTRFGIPIVYDNPEVGKNLIDRKEVSVLLPKLTSLEGDDIALFDVAAIAQDYWALSFHSHSIEWANLLNGCNSCSPVNRTDTCFRQMFGALSLYGIERNSTVSPVFVGQRRPMTRGAVSLASSDYNDHPIVNDGWNLSLESLSKDARKDLDVIVGAMEDLVLNVIRHTSLLDTLGYPASNKSGYFPIEIVNALNKGLRSGINELDECSFSEIFHSNDQCSTWETCFPTFPILPNNRDKLREIVFETLASSHHCVGTCRAGAVVQKGSLAVMGVEGLYISDVSVVTQPVDMNPMMTAMTLGLMMGESVESIPTQEYERFPVILSIICIAIFLLLVLLWVLTLVNRNTLSSPLIKSSTSRRISITDIWKSFRKDASESSLNDEHGNEGSPNVTFEMKNKNKGINSESTMRMPLMAWKDVSCTYETGSGRKKSVVTTLFNNFGTMNEGEVTAIMGPSGAAKSTLLDILAGRKSAGKVSGDFSVLGARFNVGSEDVTNLSAIIQGCSAYIPQQEYFYPTQTCEEAVAFQANMKFGGTKPEELRRLVHACLNLVGLPSVNFASRKIGGELAGGITICGLSGGERKRLTLACILALKPKMMFIDELTSGLDSENSYLIIKLLKDLSMRRRVASMVIIHQPDPPIFGFFDRLILLSKGICMFSDNVSNLRTFYECNYEEVPPDTAITGDLIAKASMFNVDSNNVYCGEMVNLSEVTIKESHSVSDASTTPGCFWKLFVIFKRNLTNQYICNITNVGARLVSYSALSVIVGAIFWQVGNSDLEREFSFEDASLLMGAGVFVLNISYLLPFSSIPIFVYDKRFLAAEGLLGLYQSWVYGVSQLFLEFAFLIVASIFETSIVFYMLAMDNPTMPSWISYLTILSIITLSGLVGSTLVFCCSIWLPSQDLAFLTGSTISTISLALSGGFVPFAEMTALAKALQWISPVKYSFQALIISQLNGTSAEKLIDISELNTPPTVTGNICVLFGILIFLAILSVIGMSRVKEVR